MAKLVVIVALITVCAFGQLVERLAPKGHGMGPSFSTIQGANSLDVCETLNSVFNIDDNVAC